MFRRLVNSSLKGCYVVFDKNVPKLSTECEGKAVLILGCLCILLHVDVDVDVSMLLT